MTRAVIVQMTLAGGGLAFALAGEHHHAITCFVGALVVLALRKG